MDYILRASAGDGAVRIFVANTHDTVQKAFEIHKTSPVMSAALGRALTGVAIMGSMLKNDKDLVTITIKGDGPGKGLTVTSNSKSQVKGYVYNPIVDIPLKPNGKLDVQEALGFGDLTVIKDIGMKEPYVGTIPLISGEIAEDLTYYFAKSEQIPSAVALGVLVDRDYSIKQSGGFIIQMMPDAPEEIISAIEEKLKVIEPLTTMLDKCMTQEDILNESDLRSVLINFSQEFGIFILIYVIMMAGSIVSEEYSRGTIKYLLTKPFRRSTILTSKLLVVLLLIPSIMIFMSLMEILIGGIILGFSSLSIPVVLFSDGAITTYSVIGYLVSEFLSIIPMYLVIGLLAFMISTLTASTSAAITVSFLFYLLGNVISNLALVYNLPIFRTCVSLYWNFSYLVTNSTQPYGASLTTSIIVILIYIVIMLFASYLFFSKKDVKNI